RLGQKDAERGKSKELDADRLQPEAQRRFIHGHKTAWIVGDKEEVMQAIDHTPHTSGIEEITETVLPQLIKVHKHRRKQDHAQRQLLPEARQTSLLLFTSRQVYALCSLCIDHIPSPLPEIFRVRLISTPIVNSRLPRSPDVKKQLPESSSDHA